MTQELKTKIQDLAHRISKRHNVLRPDNLLSDKAGVSVYAVRQWYVRGIPRKHRPLVARLAGVELEVVEKACR